jgi:arginyl-tRNA synthetase
LGHLQPIRSSLDDFHVKFGRVEGMSTRRGEVVFLRDILDEAKSRMLETMKAKTTTKVQSPADMDSVAEVLGVSAILIQDMKEYRLNNYRFSWERLVNFAGDTGVFLQYTHARLHSIVSSMSDQLQGVEPNYECLHEESARRLVQHLARFDEVLLRSYADLEPCHVVQYLFTLGRLVNVAHDELYVKGQPEVTAKMRLMLFEAAKTVVSSGLSVLGISPLDRL